MTRPKGCTILSVTLAFFSGMCVLPGYGWGTAVWAASGDSIQAGFAVEAIGLLAIMMLPMTAIMLQRYFRKKKKA